MKKNFFAGFSACIMAFAFCNTSIAQNTTGNFISSRSALVTEKSPAAKTDASPAIPSLPVYKINARVVRDFSKAYKNVEDVSWYKADDGGAMAYFTSNGIKTRVCYDTKNTWVATVRMYGEKDLPKDIRARVKSVYYDYTIYWITEITATDGLIYVVEMKENKHWKTISIGDGAEMKTMEEFDETN